MKKIKRKLKIFFKNAQITELFKKNTEKGAKIQEIQRKCKNTEQILKYRVIESSGLGLPKLTMNWLYPSFDIVELLSRRLSSAL